MNPPKDSEFSELDWIQLKKDVTDLGHHETTKERMIRKIKENPLVPLGCLATFGALSFGLWSLRTGRRKMSQYMMRTRIVAQGFTIVALLAGIAFSSKAIKKD